MLLPPLKEQIIAKHSSTSNTKLKHHRTGECCYTAILFVNTFLHHSFLHHLLNLLRFDDDLPGKIRNTRYVLHVWHSRGASPGFALALKRNKHITRTNKRAKERSIYHRYRYWFHWNNSSLSLVQSIRVSWVHMRRSREAELSTRRRMFACERNKARLRC